MEDFKLGMGVIKALRYIEVFWNPKGLIVTLYFNPDKDDPAN